MPPQPSPRPKRLSLLAIEALSVSVRRGGTVEARTASTPSPFVTARSSRPRAIPGSSVSSARARSRSRRSCSPAPGPTSTTGRSPSPALRTAPSLRRSRPCAPAREGACDRGRPRVRRAGRPTAGRDPPQLLGEARGLPRRLPRTRLGDRGLPPRRAPASAGAHEEVAGAAASPADEIPTAVDGCGVLTFALSLERMAPSFAGLAASTAPTASSARCARTRGSWAGGLARHRPHAPDPGWAAKGGAEGLLCGSRPTEPACAVKSEDGNPRPLRPALARFLDVDLGYRASRELARRGRRGGGRGMSEAIERDPNDVAAYDDALAQVASASSSRSRRRSRSSTTTRAGPPCTSGRRCASARRSARRSFGSSMRARHPCRPSPPSRSSTSCSRSRTPPTSRRTCPTSRPPVTFFDSASPSGSSTELFKGPDTNVNLHVLISERAGDRSHAPVP